MRYEMTLPKMGEDTADAATVLYWLVDEEESVSKGEDLLELTTDKATFTVQSPKKGVLVEHLVDEGDEVSVGDALCVLEV